MEENQVLELLEKKFKSVQDELKTAQENGASKDEVLKLHETLKTQGKAIEKLTENLKEKKIETLLVQFKDFVTENIKDINAAAKDKNKSVSFVSKAVEPITTGSGINVGTASPLHFNNIGNVNLRNDNALLQLANVTSTNSPVGVYTEMLPKEGDYAFVAEGGTKPQIDFKWENRYTEPKKAAAHQVLTTEVEQDVDRIMSVARNYLLRKHDLFKVNGVYFGDGTGENPEGATTIGRVFSAGNLALKVVNANFMDVVNACITDIYTTQNFTDEMPYEANVVLINPDDFYIELVSAKDGNGLPLYPQAGLFNSVTIGGVTIRPWIKIPSGKIFVADMSMYNVENYIPFTITFGWINDQFIKNQFTMVGESRFYAYVRQLDRQAFIYDDIATIRTAIQTP